MGACWVSGKPSLQRLVEILCSKTRLGLVAKRAYPLHESLPKLRSRYPCAPFDRKMCASFSAYTGRAFSHPDVPEKALTRPI